MKPLLDCLIIVVLFALAGMAAAQVMDDQLQIHTRDVIRRIIIADGIVR